jgi:hypothetical protein
VAGNVGGVGDAAAPGTGSDADALGAWCAMWLGARPVETIFAVRHSSQVTGVVLDDGRRVVVKVRPASPRLQSCAYVQHHLWHAGFPCPEPLAGPVPFTIGDHLVASAEAAVDGGEMLAGDAHGAADAYAGLLVRLVRLAPAAQDVHSLADAPPWTAWDHGGTQVWPPADDRDDDLNAHTHWLDDVGRAIRQRLGDVTTGAPSVVGHGDWEAQNLRWHGTVPVAVHDWDSVIAAPEPVIAGLAAAVWPAAAGGSDASIDQSTAFLDAYQRARGRFSAADIEAAWAAGLWVRTFNAKKASLDGLETLTPAEVSERSRLAGLRISSMPRMS